jgi:hypothetical protein
MRPSARLTGAVLIAAPLTTVGAAVVAGAPPPSPADVSRVTISADPGLIGIGTESGIGGRLDGRRVAGRAVVLEADPVPGGVFAPVATAVTNGRGRYEFTVHPDRNTRYRVELRGRTATRSPEQIVYVRMRVTMRVDDARPSRGQRVRFFGSVLPAHDGLVAHIQRRTLTGGYHNVARVPLTDAGGGRSRFEGSIPITRSGVYRILVPSHDDHTKAVSAPRVVRISS